MSRPLHPRLPLAPLIDATGSRTQTDLALRTGCHVRTVQRWRDGLTVNAADQVAVALGRHPVTIWGEDWDRVLGQVCFGVDDDEER